MSRHAFGFAASYRLPALLLGITPATAWVEVDGDGLRVRYGAWRLRTRLDNLAAVSLTGDFAWWRTAGPPHLSLADRGISFTTNGQAAACVSFRDPVAGIEPTGRLRHPGATLSLADPGRFAAELVDLGVPLR